MKIELREVTWDNWKDCLAMKVKPGQEDFLTTNEFSLAQAYVAQRCDARPPYLRVIYADGEPAGFAMAFWQDGGDSPGPDGGGYNLCRFMIRAERQGAGIGRTAFGEIVRELARVSRNMAGCVTLNVEPENLVALRLYERYGFEDTGARDYGEIVMRLRL